METDDEWLNVIELADVDVSSANATRPIDFALLPIFTSGWRASGPGRQKIRLTFARPIKLGKVKLVFVENALERTQEYVLRWSPDNDDNFREAVRQQWNFSPRGSTRETEVHRLDIGSVRLLELMIIPDISGGGAVASLAQIRVSGEDIV
ncbi:hypothetical protein [Methylomarinum vadi]|uniref:hypothetical protein n=1 Tax=Methylomarinum vadi TaxID=438855 RepID=UPI0004DF07B2|nr:hypothetical protein [Methylomarinum vadi]